MRLICGIVYFESAAQRPSQDPFLLDRMCAALTVPSLKPHTRQWQSLSGALAVLDFGPSSPQLGRRGSGGILAADARLDHSADPPEPYCAAMLDHLGLPGLASLHGDFALADWHPAQHELTLARDPTGIRPLVFHYVPGKLVAFASFPRALHAAALPPRQVDPQALIRDTLGIATAHDSLFTGIQSVAPGEAVVFSPSGSRSTSYADLPAPATPYNTPEEGAEALRAAVIAAVRSRTAGAGPIATHLSGGLDSSAITVLAARAVQTQGRRLLAYSLLTPAHAAPRPGTEQAYIEDVLIQEPHIEWFPFGPGNPLASHTLPDRPLSAEPADPENAICAHAAAQGVTLLLSGWGGDEGATFNARGVLAHALLHGNLGYLAQEISAIRKLRGFTTSAILRGEVLSFLRATLRQAQPLPAFAALFAPSLLRAALASAATPSPMRSNVQHNQRTLLTSLHLPRRAVDWADIGAAHGLAFTFPLLDRRVVECALNLRATWHLRQGWKRRPFRDAMHGILPESIRWRHDKQTPFPDAHLRLATHRTALRTEIETLCRHPAAAGIFNLPHIRTLLASFPSPAELLHQPARGSPILPLMLLLSRARFLTQPTQNSLGDLHARTPLAPTQRPLAQHLDRPGTGHDERPDRILPQPV